MRNAKKPLISLGARNDELAKPLHDSVRILELPQHRPGVYRVDRMGLIEKRRHNAEVPAASANRPKQVAVLVRARHDERAIGKHNVGGQQAIDGQAVPSREVSDAAPQRQAGHACGRDKARRHREPKRVRCVIDVTPSATGADAHGLCRRVDADVLHEREIDD